MEQLKNWNKKLESLSLKESIKFISDKINGKKVFSTSFGVEDQVITHVLNDLNLPIEIFTLDTGRLFQETYNAFDLTQQKYKSIKINTFFPLETDIDNYIKTKGINGFYDSVENRKECCKIRKVIPLNRALKDAKLWITGIRAEQSENRNEMNFLEYDNNHKLIKFNPLLKWNLKDVEDFINENSIPIISLYKKGFKSIGCAPCTRAISKEEDFRAGRWWWENQDKKECGLHQ